MGSIITITVVACLLLAHSARSQTTQLISLVPKPVVIKNSLVAPGVFELTPTIQGHRQLLEPLGRRGRRLQASFGPPITLGAAIVSQVGGFLNITVSAGITVGRKLLDTPTLTLLGEVKKDALTGVAVATYLFDSSTAPFLAGFAQSGSDATSSYQFLRAVLLFPQDLVYGGIPSYAVSNRAFIPDSNHPILVRLSTKRPTDYVPSIALRFDYLQMGTDPSGAPVTPQVSVLYTDLVNVYPIGLPGTSPTSGAPQINLYQSFDWVPGEGEDALLTGSSV